MVGVEAVDSEADIDILELIRLGQPILQGIYGAYHQAGQRSRPPP